MTVAPTCETDILDVVADAIRDATPLDIRGGGSKAGVGAPPVAGTRTLDMTGISGIVDYDPPELVLTARAGTRLDEIEAMIRAEGQMLAFEPFDCGPWYESSTANATIGGTVAAGIAGSQRVSCGGARDHLLGFRAVSGHGEAFHAGGKVVKNVTGFDLAKLAAGSWGRLFAMTELTLKVLPRPLMSVTRLAAGLSPGQAVSLMAQAMGSQADVAAAAHIPGELLDGPSVTMLRIQGFGPSVAARAAMLDRLFEGRCRLDTASETDAAFLWNSLRTLALLGTRSALWRVNVAPSQSEGVIQTAAAIGAKWMMDWAGGLIWLASDDADAGAIRDAAARARGHAKLMRGPDRLRAGISAFQPQSPSLAALETRVRRAFDPKHVFETGRF